MGPEIPVIAADGDAAKIAAVAVRLFGHVEAARTINGREAAARAAGDMRLARTWQRVAAEIGRYTPN